ncbi:ATP-binding protein [Bradyrhizobium vignae]|uniref:ATP-binding protein n=1 Tax=Bradyrhizobium vignae TaxID=1549949 RepID=UPI001359B19F|nr:ATP-binding protein [Bradyrhizobium vignae]
MKKALEDFFRSEAITTFSTFEIFGAVDVILQAWIPRSNGAQIVQRMREHIKAKDCRVHQGAVFNVDELAFHSYWQDRARVVHGDEGLAAQHAFSRLSSNKSDKQAREVLRGANWLREIEAEDNQIRVFISISPGESASLAVEDHLQKIIIERLSKSGFREPVLYKGVGRYTTLLIEGLVPAASYFEISRFNDGINRSGLHNIGMKTTTYLTTSNIAVVDRPTISTEVRDARDYLTSEESEKLELKGSFDLDVNKLLMTDKIEKLPVLRDEILGTVVAFLNSDGGEIVIGAVEEVKFKGVALEKLKTRFPAVGEMRIIGIAIENEFLKDKSWDGYQRRLIDLIASRIGTDFGELVRVRRLSIDLDGDQQADLCLVQVFPAKGDLAFLDQQKCFLRSGASTREVTGNELLRLASRRRGR